MMKKEVIEAFEWENEFHQEIGLIHEPDDLDEMIVTLGTGCDYGEFKSRYCLTLDEVIGLRDWLNRVIEVTENNTSSATRK